MDPMRMEEANKPLNFDRLMKYSKGLKPFVPEREEPLLPAEILAITEEKMTRNDYINMTHVSELFQKDIREYIKGLANHLGTVVSVKKLIDFF